MKTIIVREPVETPFGVMPAGVVLSITDEAFAAYVKPTGSFAEYGGLDGVEWPSAVLEPVVEAPPTPTIKSKKGK